MKKQRGLYRSKVTDSLACIQRPGNWTHNCNCKMAYSHGQELLGRSRKRLKKRPLDLFRVPLQCVRAIAPERGWGGHFHTFTVFLSTQPRLGVLVCWNAGRVYEKRQPYQSKPFRLKRLIPIDWHDQRMSSVVTPWAKYFAVRRHISGQKHWDKLRGIFYSLNVTTDCTRKYV